MMWRNRDENEVPLETLSLRIRQIDDRMNMFERRISEIELRMRGRDLRYEPISGAMDDIRTMSDEYHSMIMGDPVFDDAPKEKKEEGWD